MARVTLFDVLQPESIGQPGLFAPGSVGRQLGTFGAGGGGDKLLGMSSASTIDAPLLLASAPAGAHVRRRIVVAGLSGLLVALALALVVVFVPDPSFAPGSPAGRPLDGLTVFAIFFACAFAIERLLEPVSKLLLPKTDVVDNLSLARQAAAAAAKAYVEAHFAEAELNRQVRTPPVAFGQGLWPILGRIGLGRPDSSPTEEEQRALEHQAEEHRRQLEESLPAAREATARARQKAQVQLDETARAVAAYEDRDYVRTILFWALATVVAVLASASLNLYFLRTIGVTAAERWLEILATGLIIGAGTKPLHELTTMLTERKSR